MPDGKSETAAARFFERLLYCTGTVRPVHLLRDFSGLADAAPAASRAFDSSAVASLECAHYE